MEKLVFATSVYDNYKTDNELVNDYISYMEDTYDDFNKKIDMDEVYGDAYGWYGDMLELYFDDFRQFILKGPVGKIATTVTGVLGLWDGKHTIEPKEFDTFEDAFWACADNHEFKLYFENDELRLTAIHHDGRNNFILKKADGTDFTFDELTEY